MDIVSLIVHLAKKAATPDGKLHRRAEELSICGSVQNKLALARECMARGQFEDAITLYESACEGPLVLAPDVLLGLARARFLNGEPQPALGLLDVLGSRHPDYYPEDVAILKAQAADHVRNFRIGATGESWAKPSRDLLASLG